MELVLQRDMQKRGGGGGKVEPGQQITTHIFSSDDENEEPSALGSKQEKKVPKKINLILAKLTTTMRKNRNGNTRNVKSFGMKRVVIEDHLQYLLCEVPPSVFRFKIQTIGVLEIGLRKHSI